MRSRSRLALVALTAALGAAGTAPAAQRPPDQPRLLVIVVIDQMRADYLDRYAKLWEHGLKRIRDEGAIFERGFYPYLNTVTCAGHATIGTGAFPSTHGIIMNEWWQRGAGRRMPCTDDPSVTSLSYGGTADRIGHSGHRLKIPTMGDRLRATSPQSRVVTLSMKPRSTVMLAGRGGTAVTWFGDSNSWATSTAFAATPLPDVAAYVSSHPVDRDRETIWTRARDAADYQGEDRSPFERPRPAWSSEFPHPLAGAPGSPPAEFYNLWERSPFSDAYLGAMAAAQVKAFQLGQREVVDYLGVSFSALDYVGHDFGPDSHEVQDGLIRLDRTLGQLFAALDAMVGRNRWVLGLSADHGVAPIPEAQKAAGRDAGRVVNAQVRKVAESAMLAAHGQGSYVALVEYTNLYLTDSARLRAEQDPAFLKPLVDAVATVPGVQRVFPARGLESRRGSADPVERAAALSYYPGESGDVVVVLKPNWIGTDTSTTTHGSMNPYDQHVPVIFMGAWFTPGRYAAPASPADIAPTLASLVKLPMPGIDGKALQDSLRK
jgi:hypothetical protein